eukprot:CAMPEP_0196601726 /NCGR_PEP_ID=MMETSP1081-20130531/96059_1 /TAXON_ID=36882 /ORGANISM="Pyramimonas amylifera, Strain CCMP720" /LENGTH=65 /DNA_ID=CAMNT_0041927613 /DNA_START=462 /DNA_END=659 /DNA_ORIENTATION=-
MGAQCEARERSHVLKAQGVKHCSAARTTAGWVKMRPASLQPCQPCHSTKLAKMGLPHSAAAAKAI